MFEELSPNTIIGVKRLASQLKKSKGIKHHEALDLASKSAGCDNYRHAQRILPVGGDASPNPYVLLTRYWLDEKKSLKLWARNSAATVANADF